MADMDTDSYEGLTNFVPKVVGDNKYQNKRKYV